MILRTLCGEAERPALTAPPDDLLTAFREGRTGCLSAILLPPTLLIGAIAIFFIVHGAGEIETQRRLMHSAIEVEATIQNTRVERSVSSHGTGAQRSTSVSYIPHVEYSYTHGGRAHMATGIWPVPESFSDRAEAQAAISRYRPGQKLPAFVDPDDPERAYLEARWSGGPHAAVGVGGAALCFLASIHLLVLGWRSVRAAKILLVVALAALWTPVAIAATAYLEDLDSFGPVPAVLTTGAAALAALPAFIYIRIGRVRRRLEAAIV